MNLRNDWSSYLLKAVLPASLAASLVGGGCSLTEAEPGGVEETEDRVSSNLGPAALFEVDVSPDSRTIGLDDFASYSVSVTPLEGFAGDVSLDLAASPAFVGSLTLFPTLVTPPDTAFIDVFTGCDTEPDQYTLTVTGTADDGTTATSTAELTVEQDQTPPDAFFFVFEQGDLTFEFIDSTFDDFCDQVVAWQWDFGDGTTSTEERPTHTYAARGEYTVTLTVTTESGLGDSISETLIVLPDPFPLSIFRVTRDPATFEFRVDLRWSGAEGTQLRLFRNSFEVDLPDNDGVHRDRFRTTSTSFDWRMCELGLDYCSNTVVLDVGPDGAIGDLATVRAVIDGREVVQSLRIEDGSED